MGEKDKIIKEDRMMNKADEKLLDIFAFANRTATQKCKFHC